MVSFPKQVDLRYALTLLFKLPLINELVVEYTEVWLIIQPKGAICHDYS